MGTVRSPEIGSAHASFEPTVCNFSRVHAHTHFQSTMSLPADVQSALREAFDMSDADKDGRVTHKELAQVLQKLKINANMDTLMGMIKKIDTDNSGTVEFNEFVDCLTPCLTCKEFDNDGNGYIEADELRQKLEEMSGEVVTEAEVADMIKQVNMDGDGKINYEEFKKLMAEE